MKKLLAVFGLVGFLLCAGKDAFAQGMTWSEPDIVNGYAYVDNGSDESNPKVASNGAGRMVSVWNTHSGGIGGALSTDGGTSWSGLPLPGEATSASAFDTAVVYAGNNTWVIMWVAPAAAGEEGVAVYMTSSVDNGETWTPATLATPAAGDTGFISDIASDKAGTIIVIANRSVIRSTDFGQSWTQIGDNESRRSYIAYAEGTTWYRAHSTYDLEFGGTPVYAVTIYKSVDNGATWVEQFRKASAFTALFAGALETSGHQVVMPVINRQNDVGYVAEIHTSSDSGVTWNNDVALPLPPQAYYLDVRILLERNESKWMLYIGDNTDHSIYLSSDPTTTWTAGVSVPGHNPSNGTIAFAPYGAADFTALYVSSDLLEGAIAPDKDIVSRKSAGGVASWSDAVFANPAAEVDLPSLDDYNLRMAAGDNGTVIGIWNARVDDGATWPDDTIEKMIGRSSDHGRTWPVQGQPLKYLVDDEFSTYTRMYFDIGYLGGESFILVTLDGTYNISHDNGMTWNPSQQVTELAGFARYPYGFAPTGAIMCTGYAEADETSSIERHFTITSTDYGESWQEPVEIPAAPYVYVHTGGSSWFARADNDMGYISADNGQTWDVREQPWDQYGTSVKRSNLDSDGNGTLVEYRESNSRTSFDGGRTWTDPVLVAENYGSISDQRVASIGGTRWMAVWQDFDEQPGFKYAISADNGMTWSSPVTWSSHDNSSVDELQLLVSGGLVSIAWRREANPGPTDTSLGTDSDSLFSGSSDFVPVTAAKDWSLYQ